MRSMVEGLRRRSARLRGLKSPEWSDLRQGYNGYARMASAPRTAPAVSAFSP